MALNEVTARCSQTWLPPAWNHALYYRTIREMKSLFEESTRQELISRVRALQEGQVPQWGRMNVYQMLKHCALSHDMVLHNRTYPRVFIGRLLGRMLLQNEVKDDRPMRQGNPTIPALEVHETAGTLKQKNTRSSACSATTPGIPCPTTASCILSSGR